jgi:hypothetical protein
MSYIGAIINIIDTGINPYVVGLQTKGKFSCPICGPRMEYRCSRSLGNEVFNENKHFLPKNHSY